MSQNQDYRHILETIKFPDRIQHLSNEAKKVLLSSGLPTDYVLFLGEVGYGDFEEFQIYDGPIKPETVYPNATNVGLDQILLIGDDFQGFCFGFDAADGMRLVEVDPRGVIDRTVESSFSGVINRYFKK